MTQSNIKILLFLLGVVLLGGVYMYVFKGNMEDKDDYDSQAEELQVRLDDLNAKNQKRNQYIEDTKRYLAEFKEGLKDFPASLTQEKSVMFIKGVDKKDDFELSSIGLGQPSLFYTLSAAPGDAADGYACYTAAFPLSYSGSYEGVKEFVQYVMDYPERMNLSSVDITYSEVDSKYTGSIILNAYCVTGGDRVDEPVNVSVPEGVDNIFVGGNGAASGVSTRYDSDNGRTIAGKHELNILLNNANNDTADGIIVTGSGTNVDDTMVSSAANDVAELNVSIEEAPAGGYVVTYAIGDSSKAIKITSSDLKIYVKSSKRVDSGDTNGIKLNVKNTTSCPVFVLVDNDDPVNPRFKLGSKTGLVKVY